MIYSILIFLLSTTSLSEACLPGKSAPGTLRVLQTAQALTDSSDGSLHQIHTANVWIATTTADIGDAPPQGPPDSVTATPRAMADWAISSITAASSLGLSEGAVIFAKDQVDCISRLLIDVDTTKTEPPDPYALAQVQLCAGELAWVRGDTAAALTMALAAGKSVSWGKDVFVADSIQLSRLLAKLGQCDELERMAKTIPPREIPSLIASAASEETCQIIASKLLAHPTFDIPGRRESLLYELKKVHGGATAEVLIDRFPSVLNAPANRLTVTYILLSDGRIQKGLEILGGDKILARLKGQDSTDIHFALCLGYIRNGDLTQARAMITSINGLEERFNALVKIDSRLLLKHSMTPADTLKEFTNLRFIPPTGLDTFIPRIAKRPLNIDIILSALIESNRFELAATLLRPLFAPDNQTGDEWLEQRVGILTQALAITDPTNNKAWTVVINAISRCAHIDSQVKALCMVASAWNQSRPTDALPDDVKEALNQMVERIALKDHRPFKSQ